MSSDTASINRYITDCAQYNGKRLRAKLFLSCYSSFKKITDEAIKLAAVIEIIHLASLLHDDVIDNVELRRGKRALNILRGNKASILFADYILAKSINVLCGKRYSKVLSLIMETIETMSKGQLNEIKNLNNLNISVDDYFSTIKQKTASFFSVCCKIGAMLGSADKKSIAALEKFGLNFGILFQIMDDVMDFWGDEKELGKPIFSDLMQKNFTLPVILLLKEADVKDKKKIKYILKSKKITKLQAKTILSLLDKYKIKEDISDITKNYHKRVLKSLSSARLKDKVFIELRNILNLIISPATSD